MKKQLIYFFIVYIFIFSGLIKADSNTNIIKLEEALVNLGLDVRINESLERIEANAKGINLAFISNSNYYKSNDRIKEINKPVISIGTDMYIERSDFEKIKQEDLREIEHIEEKGDVIVQEIEEKAPEKAKKPVLNKSFKKKVIVLDPGHGGKDPGAIGYRGSKEKDINLQMALKIKKYIEDHAENITVYMTREDDNFIPLSGRTRFTNKRKADLFVSIHCNASKNKQASGFEAYYLSYTASSKRASLVAQLENAAIKYEKNSNSNVVLQILSDMKQTKYIDKSVDLAKAILSKVQTKHILSSRDIYSAMFYVLRDAAMPAVLIECGFITNKEEEKLLNNNNFQYKLSKLIADALINYLTPVSN